MKKTLIIAALSLSTATAFCQAKQFKQIPADTTHNIKMSQAELVGMSNALNEGVVLIHKTHMDSFRRDSIDMYLDGLDNYIRAKFGPFVDKTKKKGDAKP